MPYRPANRTSAPTILLLCCRSTALPESYVRHEEAGPLHERALAASEARARPQHRPEPQPDPAQRTCSPLVTVRLTERELRQVSKELRDLRNVITDMRRSAGLLDEAISKEQWLQKRVSEIHAATGTH